jgi:hypothetical protein
MLRRVALVRNDFPEDCIVFIIRLSRISETLTALAVPANAVCVAPILVTLVMEVIRSSLIRLLQEPHGVTFQKRAFFLNTQ